MFYLVAVFAAAAVSNSTDGSGSGPGMGAPEAPPAVPSPDVINIGFMGGCRRKAKLRSIYEHYIIYSNIIVLISTDRKRRPVLRRERLGLHDLCGLILGRDQVSHRPRRRDHRAGTTSPRAPPPFHSRAAGARRGTEAVMTNRYTCILLAGRSP